MTLPRDKKPSPLMIWAARNFAGFDDLHVKLLPPDAWIFKNAQEAAKETPRGRELTENITAGGMLTGAVLGAGALVTATVGAPALALGGLALAAAGGTGFLTWKKIQAFQEEVLPEAKKSLARRFMAFQALRVKDAVVGAIDKPALAEPMALKPGSALARIFNYRKKAIIKRTKNEAKPSLPGKKGNTP